MFQTNVVEKIKTHILFSVTFFEYHVVYEIMWKNIVDPDRPQPKIRHIRISRQVSKAANAQSRNI